MPPVKIMPIEGVAIALAALMMLTPLAAVSFISPPTSDAPISKAAPSLPAKPANASDQQPSSGAGAVTP